MSFLDGGKSEQIKFLEEERNKLWSRVTSLEGVVSNLNKEVLHKTSDSEKEAKEHSRKAAEYRNKTEARLEEGTNIVHQLNMELEEIRKIKNEINAHSVSVNEDKLAIDESKSRIDDVESEYQKKVDTLDSRVKKVDDIFDKYPEVEETLTEIEGFIDKIEENQKKSSVSLSAINNRKKEIDDLYLEIFGYTEKSGEDEKEEKVPGLKDELDTAYEKLEIQLKEAEKNIEKTSLQFENKFQDFEKSHNDKYKSITDEITKLLPNALTAGLSSAFSKKKTEEEVEATKLQKRFTLGINIMIAVSIIPIIISVIFIYQKTPLFEVIQRLPRIVLAIIPMYIPILWFTYSASKKLNLSKRLIEEYAHKEVLSKTYEGLATQISSINNPEQSEELRFRLLTNFLQVTSENPGKLISNYEASDHPVMEALEQSYKFQLAIDKLDAIPGIGKVAAILEKKSKRKMVAKKEIIEKALDEDGVNTEVNKE